MSLPIATAADVLLQFLPLLNVDKYAQTWHPLILIDRFYHKENI